MRIISGIHKGRRIIAPKNLPVRPTTDRAKESLFNILENKYILEEKKILDLFCGTGNISFEFSSRYKSEITAVDINKKCIRFVEKINKELNLNIKTVLQDCFKFIKNNKNNYDVIFLDPPYDYDKYYEVKDFILENEIINKNGCLIIEHDKRIKFDEKNTDVRKYGNVFFTMFNL